MLTDEEAETIRRKLAEGWRGPVLLIWLEQLLRAPGREAAAGVRSQAFGALIERTG